jgi:lincosamide nucleotidyltransferase A/C/D/E
MRGADVIELYQALAAAGVDIWIDGGWAVDALVGRQTRRHLPELVVTEGRDHAQVRVRRAEFEPGGEHQYIGLALER